MKKTNFPTPQDAEAAFYDALENADLEAMMEVWSEDEEVSCVHPGGRRIAGRRAACALLGRQADALGAAHAG